MSKLVPVTYTAPSHWASYLINGDASGISDEDVREADSMCECIREWHPGVKFGSPRGCEDAGFLWRPDFGGEGADCQTYTWLVREED